MLVKKKRQVQKSFRIDENVERDLAILAEKTERSQNELANCALVELLQDNKIHFLEDVVWEHFMCQIEDGKETLEPFEMGGLTVSVDKNFNVEHALTSNGEVCERVSEKCQNLDELEKYLKNISNLINCNSEDVAQYLNERTNYSDYVKVSNNPPIK